MLTNYSIIKIGPPLSLRDFDVGLISKPRNRLGILNEILRFLGATKRILKFSGGLKLQ